jgi:hypothetical protein
METAFSTNPIIRVASPYSLGKLIEWKQVIPVRSEVLCPPELPTR